MEDDQTPPVSRVTEEEVDGVMKNIVVGNEDSVMNKDSNNTSNEDKLKTVNYKLREKLKQFQKQNIENCKIAEKEIRHLNEIIIQLTSNNNNNNNNSMINSNNNNYSQKYHHLIDKLSDNDKIIFTCNNDNKYSDKISLIKLNKVFHSWKYYIMNCNKDRDEIFNYINRNNSYYYNLNNRHLLKKVTNNWKEHTLVAKRRNKERNKVIETICEKFVICRYYLFTWKRRIVVERKWRKIFTDIECRINYCIKYNIPSILYSSSKDIDYSLTVVFREWKKLYLDNQERNVDGVELADLHYFIHTLSKYFTHWKVFACEKYQKHVNIVE